MFPSCSFHVPLRPITLHRYVIFKKKNRLLTPRIRLVWTSPDANNDQWFRAQLFVNKNTLFSKTISIVYPSDSTSMNFSGRYKWSVNPCASFCKIRYFSKSISIVYPLEFDSYELLRTLKMISESVRIFLYKIRDFSKTYFDCLPLDFDSYELLRTLKMISESARIFL